MYKNLEIIPATARMVDKIVEVLQETIKTCYSSYYNKAIVDYCSNFHDKSHTLNRIESGNYFILTDHNEIIGTGDFEGNHIYAVYILPEYQNTGAGSSIMNFLEKEIHKNFGTVTLEASIPALKFYENRGYKKIKPELVNLNDGTAFSYDIMALNLNEEQQ